MPPTIQIVLNDATIKAIKSRAKDTGKNMPDTIREALAVYLLANGCIDDPAVTNVYRGYKGALAQRKTKKEQEAFKRKLRARAKKARDAVRKARELKKKKAEEERQKELDSLRKQAEAIREALKRPPQNRH